MFWKIDTSLFKSTLKKFYTTNHFIHFTGSIIIIKIWFASLNSQYPGWMSYPALLIKALAYICHIYFAKMENFNVYLT